MQGQKSTIDPFRDAIDIGLQGSDSNSGGMNNQQPAEQRRWSSFVSPGEACLNNASSSNSNGTSEQQSFGDSGPPASMAKEILFPPRAILTLGGAHQTRNGGPSFSQGSGSSHQGMDLNEGYVGNNSNQDGIGSSNLAPNLYLSGTSASSDIGGNPSGGDGGSGPLGSWGLSCKRKALEGTSGQSSSSVGGSSSSFLQPENSAWHNSNSTAHYGNNLRLSGPSSGSSSSSSSSSSEPRNPRPGIVTGAVASNVFPPSSVSTAVSQHEPIPFNVASPAAGSGGGGRRLSLRHVAFGGDSGAGPTPGQPQMMYLGVPGFSGRNHHPVPWHGAPNSRPGSAPSPFPFGGGDRGHEPVREEASLRSVPRTNVELPMFVSASASELRNSARDPGSSALAGASLGIPSSTRVPSGSSNLLLPTPSWGPPQSSSAQNRQRAVEYAPWTLFPSIEPQTQTGGRSGHQEPLPPPGGPSSSRDPMPSGRSNSQSRQQPYMRSAFLADRQGEDALNISNSLRVLSADTDGRRRLISEIRQVLHAMRRGENLQIEDFMVFDPFIYEMTEMHDRHRDMRLDVDNMSYEELLALEERIGDVNTGLTEEIIFKLMKHRKYQSATVQPGSLSEPCCICQEEYGEGDDVGALDCGHDFHSHCVKQWLMQKNLCPICKTTGLLT